MKASMTKALELLNASLEPPKHELNELDWKAALSPDKKAADGAPVGVRQPTGRRLPGFRGRFGRHTVRRG